MLHFQDEPSAPNRILRDVAKVVATGSGKGTVSYALIDKLVSRRERTVLRFSAFFLISIGFCVLRATGQTSNPLAPPDPYRNFIGTWSGTIPITIEKLPKTVKLVVTEESDQTAMRWDYTFGIKGEDGFERETRWVILQPPQSKVLFDRKHSMLVPYQAQGLRNFAQIG